MANCVESRSADREFLCINAGFEFLSNIYAECAKRWQQSLDPELDRSEWRDEEVRLVYYMLAMVG